MIRFLRLIVNRALSGDTSGLKEYVIGTEVFDKIGTFDPRIDSIVRVEARRLRQKLETYYRGEGHQDSVLIELKPGTYVPVFRRRDGSDDGEREVHGEAAAESASATGISESVRLPDEARRSALQIGERLHAIENRWHELQAEYCRIRAELGSGESVSAPAVAALRDVVKALRIAGEDYHAVLEEFSSRLEADATDTQSMRTHARSHG